MWKRERLLISQLLRCKLSTEGGYRMCSPKVVHTLWDDVEIALREGTAPEKSELLSQLTESARKLKPFTT